MSEGGDIPATPQEGPNEELDPEPRQHRRLPSGWASDFISKQYKGAFADLNPSITRNLFGGLTPLDTAKLFPSIKNMDLLFPQLTLRTSIMDPVLEKLGKNFLGIMPRHFVFGSVAKILEQHREQWDSLFQGMRSLAEAFFPPNWKGVNHPKLQIVEEILLDEGIPLAWVPNQAILQALFDAPDGAARRRIIGRRWRGVASDCEGALNEITHQDLLQHRPFAMDVIQALRTGHASAAQALAANLLDSILRRNFENQVFKQVTTNKKGGVRFDLDDYRARIAFTLAPIWRAYAEYWESQGDPIPRTFGRHPSAHAVSHTQYSRINAVIGLMLVTSLLKLLDSELQR